MSKKTKKLLAEAQRARAAFWERMSWVVPIFVAVFLSLFLYMLTYFTGPLAELKTEQKHLLEELHKLTEQVEHMQKEDKRELHNGLSEEDERGRI